MQIYQLPVPADGSDKHRIELQGFPSHSDEVSKQVRLRERIYVNNCYHQMLVVKTHLKPAVREQIILKTIQCLNKTMSEIP